MALLRTGALGASEDRTTCDNCGVAYASGLTRGSCPVCGTSSGIEGDRVRSGQDRFLGLAVAAMIVNLLLLGWLATLYLRA